MSTLGQPRRGARNPLQTAVAVLGARVAALSASVAALGIVLHCQRRHLRMEHMHTYRRGEVNSVGLHSGLGDACERCVTLDSIDVGCEPRARSRARGKEGEEANPCTNVKHGHVPAAGCGVDTHRVLECGCIAWALAASFIIRAVQAGSIVAGIEGVGAAAAAAAATAAAAAADAGDAGAAAASLDTMRSTRTP